MIQGCYALLAVRGQEVSDSILPEPAMLSSMILIGIQPWINKHKIDAIELVKPEMSPSID